MVIHTADSKEFKKYGRIISSLDTEELIKEMAHTPLPDDVIYIPSVTELEALPIFQTLQTVLY